LNTLHAVSAPAVIHPLFITLAQRPNLFAEHADAYADLALAKWQGVTGQLASRALIWVVTAVLGLVGLMLLGNALLLWAAVPLASMPLPWLLWAVPAVQLTVRDDGEDFSPTRVPHGRHGLSCMRVRMASHGGRLTVLSAPGHGTTITADARDRGQSVRRRPRRQAVTPAGVPSSRSPAAPTPATAPADPGSSGWRQE